MKLKIVGIENAGNLNEERIVIKALLDDQIGEYALFKSQKIGAKKVSSITSNTFWFTDHEVKKGDLVIIYTKEGEYQTNENEKGTTSHSFYWDKKAPIWNDTNDAIVLLHIDEWSFKFLGKKE